MGEKLQITDADLQAEWTNTPADRKTAGVNGQEIVLRVAKPEFSSTVQQKPPNSCSNSEKTAKQ